MVGARLLYSCVCGRGWGLFCAARVHGGLTQCRSVSALLPAWCYWRLKCRLATCCLPSNPPLVSAGSGDGQGQILQRFPEKDWEDNPFPQGIELVSVLSLGTGTPGKRGRRVGQVTPWHCVHTSCWALQGLIRGTHERGVPTCLPTQLQLRKAAGSSVPHPSQAVAEPCRGGYCCVPCLRLAPAPLLAALLALLL